MNFTSNPILKASLCSVLIILLGSCAGWSKNRSNSGKQGGVSSGEINEISTYILYDNLREFPDSLLNKGMVERIANVDSIEIKKEVYNKEGNLIFLQELDPFRKAALYKEVAYSYNTNGQVILEVRKSTRLQIVAASLNNMLDSALANRDTIFYSADTIQYVYNSKGLVTEQIINDYIFQAKFLSTINYEYNKGESLNKIICKNDYFPSAVDSSNQMVEFYYDEKNDLYHKDIYKWAFDRYITDGQYYYAFNDEHKIKDWVYYEELGSIIRKKYNYNESGQLIAYMSFYWSSWDNPKSFVRYDGEKIEWYDKNSFVYDDNGRVVEKLVQTNPSDKGVKILYIYNEEGLLVLEKNVKSDIPILIKSYYSYF